MRYENRGRTHMRIVAYTRLSQSNAHEGESHNAQAARIEAWAAEAGHTVVARCADTVSGENSVDDRPGFLDVLALLDDGEADAVAVSSMDRLARKLTTQEALLASVWQRARVMFEIGMGEVPRDDPDDPYRTFIRQVMGAAAQLERALIVKRMADGRRRAVQAGRSIGPAPSFGWTKDAEDRGRLVPDPLSYPLVVEAVRRLDGGETLRQVAAFLDEATGRRWHPPQVARLRERFGRYAIV